MDQDNITNNAPENINIANTDDIQKNRGVLRILKNKRLLIGLCLIVILTAIIAVLLVVLKSKEKEISVSEDLDKALEKNVKLSKFYGREQTVVDDPVIVDARLKIAEYAEKNNITVTVEEVEERKAKLVSDNGQEAIDQTLQSYGWTEEDWTEVLKSKILNEKIIAKIEPSRTGEVLSVRWDVYSPVLNQKVADLRKGPATEFLNKVKSGLKDKSIKDLYTVHQNFDIASEPIFDGLEENYALQYSGWDENTNSYKQFLIAPGNSNYEFVMATNPPEVTDVNCTLGGCQIYNIISGVNGDPEGNEILKLIKENNIQF